MAAAVSWPPLAPTKVCSACRQELPVEDFYLLRIGGTERQSRCKRCHSDSRTIAYYARRSRRAREVRARTISAKHMTRRETELGRLLHPPVEGVERPKTRAECENAARPCPFVSCKFHLYLDVSERTGSVKLNFPDLEPDEMAESCVLDVADKGGATLENVGVAMNITRERVRQLEVKALSRPGMAVLADHMKPGAPRRRLRVVP